MLTNTLTFISDFIIPALFTIAFLAFVWNLVQYAIFQGTSQEGREKAKSLMLWSIIAFVVMISLWGIVNLLVDGLGLDNTPVEFDYMCEKDPSYCNQ